jgi:hypothetical protein
MSTGGSEPTPIPHSPLSDVISDRFRIFWELFAKDPAVRYSLLSKLVAFGFGPFVILFVGAFMSPEEQGVYYVFGSLLQLRTFIDLGFSQSAQQLLAHAFSSLAFHRTQGIRGEKERLDAYLSIGRLVVHIYLWLGFATLLLLGLGGYLYLTSTLKDLSIDWKGPWWAMILSLGLSIGFQGFVTVSDSANLIAETNKWRFFSECAGIVVFLAFLGSGGGLWASSALSWARSLVLALPITATLGGLVIRQIMTSRKLSADYLRGIAPLQARNMVAYGMGFVVFYLYNPMALSISGALSAGLIGMSLQINNMVLNLSTTWINSKIPLMGNLAGSGAEPELLALHDKGLAITVLSWLGASLAVLAAAFAGKLFWPEIGSRYATLPVLACFVMGGLGQTWSHLRASYIRAHRIEPFAMLSIFQGLLTVALLWLLLPQHSVGGASAAFIISMATSALWVEVTFRRYRKHFTGI